MTRKDYVLIAAAVAAARYRLSADRNALNGIRVAAEEVATALARDNARFDRERFLTACGVQS